ncbi:MAG TPA: nitronate monooxygenase [Paludibaculum sp.]|jgi:nitronate monooxygenase
MEKLAELKLPTVIQGGMGVGVSGWRLARAVAKTGQLGVVSGTALDRMLLRRLQDGDPGGHMRRALDHFPFPAMAARVWDKYYIAGGKAETQSYANSPQFEKDMPREVSELLIVSNFVEIWLAREGHSNPVGINYLEKIQPPHLASIYGSMLAGVDYILMGAGIPMRVPGILDKYANHEPATYPLYVAGAKEGDDTTMRFDPREFMEGEMPPLRRPWFLAIIASNTLAVTMVKKANGRVDGFIIEGPTAGGHNAPPRGKLQVNDIGEPIYGERDVVDLPRMCELGLPFWLAGGYGSAEQVRAALAAGAAGVQVGTAFAFCVESGLRDDYKRAVLQKVMDGTVSVFTDRLASPTGFPFKVVQLDGTVSEKALSDARHRICDLGYLREAFRAPDGSIDFRCGSEPISLFVSKGGAIEETVGRKCVCNALMATTGHPQIRAGKHLEAGIITSGDDLTELTRFIPAGGAPYHAADVVAALMGGTVNSGGADDVLQGEQHVTQPLCD